MRFARVAGVQLSSARAALQPRTSLTPGVRVQVHNTLDEVVPIPGTAEGEYRA